MRKQGETLKIIWWMYIALLFVFVVVKFKGSLNNSEGLYASIVTFVSFLVGELVEYAKIRFNNDNK